MQFRTHLFEQAAENCERGFTCLARTHELGYLHKELLKTACDFFLVALQQQRKDPDANMGMGHLLLLLGDFGKGYEFLLEAHKANDNSEEITNLLEYAQQQLSIESEEQENPKTYTDLDYLYDELDALVYIRSKIMTREHPVQPVAEEQALQDLQQSQIYFQRTYRYICNQLLRLDQELDTHDIKSKLGTFEIKLKRLERAIRQSHDLIALQKRIQQEMVLVCSLLEETQGDEVQEEDIEILEENLEIILDHMDVITRKLEPFDKKMTSLQPLMENYEHLGALIEHLRETIDGLLEQLDL